MPEVIIPGPEGRIEGRYHHTGEPGAPIAIILHPHPLHGGTMNNKVSYALFKSFVEMGFNTLRFNYRGVGKSQGKFDHGEGELSDGASCLDWLQTHNPQPAQCWIAGFSFGAWLGMQLLMRRPEVDGFISISPPANMYDFTFLAPCPVSGLMVQGSHDDIVPQESVTKLVTKLSLQRGITIDYRTVDGADHFFTNALGVMTDHVKDHVTTAMRPPVALVANG